MKLYLNGVLVVEGKEDASYLSNYIESEIVVVNGFEMSESTINYLKGKSFKPLPEQKTFNLKENPYKEDYSIYIKTLNDLKNYEAELKKLELIEQDLLEKKKLIKVCPTCGRPLEECNE